jgi:hypothetical protein
MTFLMLFYETPADWAPTHNLSSIGPHLTRPVDKWILGQLNELILLSDDRLAVYDYSPACQAFFDFFQKQLCNVYVVTLDAVFFEINIFSWIFPIVRIFLFLIGISTKNLIKRIRNGNIHENDTNLFFVTRIFTKTTQKNIFCRENIHEYRTKK